jgi:hypothetical protein
VCRTAPTQTQAKAAAAWCVAGQAASKREFTQGAAASMRRAATSVYLAVFLAGCCTGVTAFEIPAGFNCSKGQYVSVEQTKEGLKPKCHSW